MLNERNNKIKLSKINIVSEYSRIPPQAVDLEEMILGAAILEFAAHKKFCELMKPEHFYKENHRIIAQAILDIYNKEQTVADIVYLSSYLRSKNQLEAIGGAY